MTLLESFNISRAVKSLGKGELIVVPTETVYGIVGNALDEKTYRRLNEIKNRSIEKKYTLFVKNREEIEKYAYINDNVRDIIKNMMPGPLTIILKGKNLPDYLISNDGTVGFRIPKHGLTEKILERIDFPLISTSANISGEGIIDSIDDIKRVFGKKISVYLKGVPGGGTPSTVIKIDDKIELLRRGPYKIGDFMDYNIEITTKNTPRILFVCYANIVRSPIAEMYFKMYSGFDVRSAGVRAKEGVFPTKEAIDVAKSIGVDVTHHPSKPLSREDILWADMIFATDNMVRADIYDIMGFRSRIHLVSDFSSKMRGELIPDPYKFGIEAYYKMIKLLKYHLDELKIALNEKISVI